MTTKSKQYANQCIAASGFAVMCPIYAWQLRPDLWASGQECAMNLTHKITVDGTQRFVARFADGQQAVVITRSTDALERRLEWVIGQKVVELANDTVPAAETFRPHPTTSEYRRIADEKGAKLHALAAQELPAHDCSLRKDILAARKELGLKAA